MARAKNGNKRKVESYTHREKKRVNNPPVGLVTPETDRDAGNKTYAYDPHLDPALQWAGKAERTSFEIPTVSLHVHERIDPRSIIEAVRKKNGEDFVQGSLFSQLDENPPIREAIEFYKHKHNWSNRLIAGDSLLVMNSLLEKEGMAGKVQMVYIDPPYGIKYGSQLPAVRQQARREGRQGRGPDAGAGNDQGVPRYLGARHSLLPCLSARPPAAGRELLADTGSHVCADQRREPPSRHGSARRSVRRRNFVRSYPFKKKGIQKAAIATR